MCLITSGMLRKIHDRLIFGRHLKVLHMGILLSRSKRVSMYSIIYWKALNTCANKNQVSSRFSRFVFISNAVREPERVARVRIRFGRKFRKCKRTRHGENLRKDWRPVKVQLSRGQRRVINNEFAKISKISRLIVSRNQPIQLMINDCCSKTTKYAFYRSRTALWTMAMCENIVEQ